MSFAASRADSATKSSASSALMDSLYLPDFFQAPMMPRDELTGGTALRAVTGDQEERVRHARPQRLAFLGMGGSDHRADTGIPVRADGFGSPAFHEVGDMLVHALA